MTTQAKYDTFDTYFKFLDGLALVGSLIEKVEIINYTVWTHYVNTYDKASENYPYLHCLDAILVGNLEGSVQTKNKDGTLDFIIDNFPNGHPAE